MDDRNPKQIYCFKPFPTTSVTSADKQGYWNIINSREARKLNEHVRLQEEHNVYWALCRDG